jgi:hypothetical protein
MQRRRAVVVARPAPIRVVHAEIEINQPRRVDIVGAGLIFAEGDT